MANGSVFQSSRAYRPSKPSIARKQLGGSYAYNDPAAVAYGNQYAAQRKKAGVNTFGVTGKQWQNRNRGSGFNLGSLGGLLGGRSRSAEFAEQDFERQKELDRLIWERSTPNVTGVGGTVRWDRDKNMVTASLSDENQAIYDAMIGRREMFGGQVDALAGGGWQDAQQQRFDQMRAMYKDSDALEQQQRLAREQATGASSTGRYWGERAEGDVRDQRNLGLMNTAFLQSQNLIDSTLNRELGAVTMMGTLGDRANAMIRMPIPPTTVYLKPRKCSPACTGVQVAWT